MWLKACVSDVLLWVKDNRSSCSSGVCEFEDENRHNDEKVQIIMEGPDSMTMQEIRSLLDQAVSERFMKKFIQ